ncbi:MAG: hypothetical protein A3J74_00285 [Elusimicrobia bacterium RIFCSPHIGHO2_02_FULL_57_9]|nr:MAG: hypothetical protein A3J74_00285 [Elusimicrobia bacterium RIFCSPHIGHO2_02_FULL_57_9]
MPNLERVLVADDEEEDRKFLSGLLEKDGFDVKQAGSGSQTLELLKKHKFDLIITDMVMPGASGFEVIQTAQKLNPEAICIAMTGHGSLDSAVDALRMGAYGYLLKPCDEATFRNCIKRGLEKQRLTKELLLRNKELETLNKELDSRVQKATQELMILNQRMLTEMASLKEVDELKTSFLNNVSHDLRNPITSITGYLSYFLDEPMFEMSAEAKKCLSSIRQAALHMEYLITQILEAARLTSGTMRLNKTAVGVDDLMKEAVGLLQTQAKTGGIGLEVQLTGSLPVLRADRGRLLQVLSNLLGNACKFTPSGGKIILSAEQRESSIHFCVADTGPGIAPEHQPRIFEKFYQVDGSLARPFKGLGLGLRIAKDIVELHGGKIWVESRPGRGSRFHFQIPLSSNHS